MATRTKAWFFQTPQSTSYSRFSKSNKPSQSTFYDLLDSTCFKTELGDTSSETQQGIAKLCTNANAISRTSAASTSMQTLVRPHQLLMMQLGDAVQIAAGVASSYEGLKLTGITKTAGSHTRLNYQLELNVNSLSIQTPVANDYFVFEDITDSSTKKGLISALTALAAGYWSLSSTNLSPSSDTYDLKLLKDMFFDGIADAYLYIDADASSNGHALYVHSGNAGGAAANGGNLYLYPGVKTGAGADGNTYVGYNGLTIGFVGIRGVAGSGSYQTKVTGGLDVVGAIKANLSSIDPHTQMMVADASGVLAFTTPKLAMDLVVGATLAADAVPYFNGAVWTSQAGAGAKLQYITGLTSSAQTQINTKITAAVGAIVNADIAAGAAIAISKLGVLTANRVVVTNAATGALEASAAVTPTQLGYLSTATSDIQIQISALSKGSMTATTLSGNTVLIAASLVNHYTIDSSGGAWTNELPDASTVPDNTTIEFLRIGVNAPTINRPAGHTLTNIAGADVAQIAIPVTGNSAVVRKTSATGWAIIRWVV